MVSSKDELRTAILSAVRAMQPEARAAAGEAVCRHLLRWPQLLASRVLAAFWPLAGEPDIRPVLQACRAAGMPVLLPRWRAVDGVYEMAEADISELVGRRGGMEPSPQARRGSAAELAAAVWLVPGVAFDLRGNRLGRGGGYYDRLLEQAGGTFVGVAFHTQLVGQVPAELHDIRVHHVVTDHGLTECTHNLNRPPGRLLRKERTSWNRSYLALSPSSLALQSDTSYRRVLPPTF